MYICFPANPSQKAAGNVIGATTGKKSVDDPTWAPQHFSDIGKIDDVELRNEWYRTHYAENDGLLDRPDVLKAIPLPPGVTEAQLLHLRTLYLVKKDKRKKARTVVGDGKTVLDSIADFGRTHSPTARSATVRLMCALAADNDLTIRGGDVTMAFPQAPWPAHLKKLLAGMPCGYKKYFNGKPHCVEVGNLWLYQRKYSEERI